jgi:hypothetical protein
MSPSLGWQPPLAEHSPPKAVPDGMRSRACPKLGKQVADMRLDCFLGHAELPADLSVCASRCHQLEHLEFASTGLRPAFVAGRDERKGPSPLGSRTGCQVKPGNGGAGGAAGSARVRHAHPLELSAKTGTVSSGSHIPASLRPVSPCSTASDRRPRSREPPVVRTSSRGVSRLRAAEAT